MINKIKSFEEVKESNLVLFLQKPSELSSLKWMWISKKITDKIKQKINEDKSFCFDFYIWSQNFEKIFVIYFSKNDTKDINYFLWDIFRWLPEKLTLLTKSEKNVITLLNNCLLSRYKYQEFKTEKQNDEINIFVLDIDEKIIDDRIDTIKNIFLARDLGFMPANELYPESFAKIIWDTKFKNTKIKILDSNKVEKLWLGLIHNVWKWSSKKPYMVILERIIDKNLPTIWIVWKGITYDTWWIQLKPWNSMYEMKWDMCWWAVAFATMKELDEKDLNVNLVTAIPMAENHISWEAYKPSDIIKWYNWKTVDIIHTDAEWRLVLADWISYISDNYKLDKIISVATLTWACMAALGFRYAWIMWNDKELLDKFLDYSDKNFEKYNKLPFDDYLIEKTKSKIADYENLNTWVFAGSSMWAAFLYNFLMNDEKYTHLDIAWTSLNWFEPYWYTVKWMTWFWVDSLSTIIKNLK